MSGTSRTLFIFFALIVLGIGTVVLLSSHKQPEQKKEKLAEPASQVVSVAKRAATSSQSTITIASTTLNITFATTEEEREQGLSGRDSLSSDEGLLFVFEKSDTYGFWMKDMNFPIDIIWLDENFAVVDIKANALPEKYPEVYEPQAPAKYVLEVVSGFAETHAVGIGATTSLSGLSR